MELPMVQPWRWSTWHPHRVSSRGSQRETRAKAPKRASERASSWAPASHVARVVHNPRGMPVASYARTMTHHTIRANEGAGDRIPSDNSLLDEEREASMANEGGISGALMEIDDISERRQLQPARVRRRFSISRPIVVGAGLIAVAVVAWFGARRR